MTIEMMLYSSPIEAMESNAKRMQDQLEDKKRHLEKYVEEQELEISMMQRELDEWKAAAERLREK